MDKQQLFLKPDEAKFLGMAVVAKIEELEESAKNPSFNWNPEARKYLREMIEAGKSLRIKMGKLGMPVEPLPPYLEGDEDEFLTKQS